MSGSNGYTSIEMGQRSIVALGAMTKVCIEQDSSDAKCTGGIIQFNDHYPLELTNVIDTDEMSDLIGAINRATEDLERPMVGRILGPIALTLSSLFFWLGLSPGNLDGKPLTKPIIYLILAFVFLFSTMIIPIVRYLHYSKVRKTIEQVLLGINSDYAHRSITCSVTMKMVRNRPVKYKYESEMIHYLWSLLVSLLEEENTTPTFYAKVN
eukprot:gene8160-9585_t